MNRLVVLLIFLLTVGLYAQDLSKPSKKELFSRARDVLKTSLENKDYDRAGQALDYLKVNVQEGAPLGLFEEYLAMSEMGRYEEGVKLYADFLRSQLDTSYHKARENRIVVKDGLNLYLYRNLSPFNKHKADSLVARIDSTDINYRLKDLYAALVYSELTLGGFGNVADTAAAESFLLRAKKYIEETPVSEHTGYLSYYVGRVDERMQVFRDFRKDPFKHKYYTGAIGVSASFWTAFMTGGASDVLDSKMDNNFMLDLVLRIKRFSLDFMYASAVSVTAKDKESDLSKSFGYIEFMGDNPSDVMVGANVGFTAYDSRYFRVEPFIGFTEMFYSAFDEVDVASFNFGVSMDVRLLAHTPRYIGQLGSVLSLRFKYQAMYGNLSVNSQSDECLLDDGIMWHAISAGLLYELW